MLLEISGEVTPERTKRWSQSQNNTQLWMWLVMEVKFNAVKSYTEWEPGMLGPWIKANSVHFSSVSQPCLTLCNPWITAHQASLSITNSQSSLRLTSTEAVMPSSHLILCRPLLLLPPIPPSIRVFSNESALHIRWPKYWSFSFNISPSNEHPRLISFRIGTGWISMQSKELLRVFSNTTVQKHQFFSTQLSL